MKPITPNLWFNGNLKEAVDFYINLFPESRIVRILNSPADNPSAEEGKLLAIEFMINGQNFIGIDGGPMFQITEAVSFAIDCQDQAEVDHYWAALTADGGEELPCGWCRDRFGVVWQVIPQQLWGLLYSGDASSSRRAAEAMYKMKKLDIATLEAAAANSAA